jgi:small-conductance mechanosensitive channel
MRDFFYDHPTLKLVLVMVVAILATMMVVRSLRRGYVLERSHSSRRKADPFSYWFKMILYCIVALALWLGAAAIAWNLFQEG